jgi:hypothetical protein
MIVKAFSKVAVVATACVVGAVGAVALSPAAAAATSPTTVTIQFDDGNADQYQAPPSLPRTACTPRSM